MKYLLIIIVMVIGVIVCCGCTDIRSYPPIIERVNISSLDRDSIVNGHFALGSGSVKSEPSYFYYVKLENGGYKLKSILAEECTIFRDEDASPYIIAHYSYDDGLIGKQSFGEIGDEYIVRKFVYEYENKQQITYLVYYIEGEVEIHIPRNSSIDQYNP